MTTKVYIYVVHMYHSPTSVLPSEFICIALALAADSAFMIHWQFAYSTNRD